MLCRHCRRVQANRPRGLCWGCYYAPGVRELYRWVPCKGNRRGDGNMNGGYKPPPVPTAAAPGTPEKQRVLRQRVKLGVSLWHDLDGRPELWPLELRNRLKSRDVRDDRGQEVRCVTEQGVSQDL